MDAVRRVGNYLQVQDGEGCRHVLRVTSVQALSDTDPMRNETFITAAGRTIRVPQALEEIVALIAPDEPLSREQDQGPAREYDTARNGEEPWPF